MTARIITLTSIPYRRYLVLLAVFMFGLWHIFLAIVAAHGAK